jgi:hypothetical protein
LPYTYPFVASQCSKAFIRLETLKELSQEERDGMADLALKVFTKNAPSDPSSRNYNCPKVFACQ